MSALDRLDRLRQKQGELDQFESQLNPDTRGTTRKAFSVGIDQFQGSLAGGVAAVADVAGANRVRDTFVDNMVDNNAQAAKDSEGIVTSIDQAESVGDFAEWALFNIASQVPSMAATIGLGVATGGVGAIGARAAATKVLQDQIGKQAAKNIASGMTKKVAMNAATKSVTQKAATAGQIAGFSVPSVGQAAGEIYGSIDQETGKTDEGAKALVGGAVAGLLDAAPLFRLTKLAGVADDVVKQGIRENVKEAGLEAIKQAGAEGATEAVQTVLEHATVDWVEGNLDLFTEERLDEILNAAASGALLGSITGGGGSAIGSLRAPAETDPKVAEYANPEKELPKTMPDADKKAAQAAIKAFQEKVRKEAQYHSSQGDQGALVGARKQIRDLEARSEELEALPEWKDTEPFNDDFDPEKDWNDAVQPFNDKREPESKWKDAEPFNDSFDPETDWNDSVKPFNDYPEITLAGNGKPWKTEKAATRALKNHKVKELYEVAPTKGGYALELIKKGIGSKLDKEAVPAGQVDRKEVASNDSVENSESVNNTPIRNISESQIKEFKRREAIVKRTKKRYTVSPDKDDLLTAISKLGGLNTELENDFKGRLKHIKTPVGMPSLEQKGDKGLSLDALAENLMELGYIPSTDIGNGVDQTKLADLIERAAAGESVVSMEAEAAAFFSEDDSPDLGTIDGFLEAYPDMAESYFAEDGRDQLPDDFYAPEIQRSEDARALTELTQDLEGLGIASDAIDKMIESMAKAGDDTRTIMRDLFALAEDLRNEQASKSGSDGSREASTGDGLLESYSEQDIADKEQADSDRKASERAEVSKAEQQDTADDFVLSGSNRPSDLAIARGQTDLLDQPDSKLKAPSDKILEDAGINAKDHTEFRKILVDAGYSDWVNRKGALAAEEVAATHNKYRWKIPTSAQHTKAASKAKNAQEFEDALVGAGFGGFALHHSQEQINKLFNGYKPEKPKPKKPDPIKKPTKGADNTLFTQSAADKARERLKAKLGRLNTGFDPELLQDSVILAGFHVESGIRSFADFTKAMVDDIGEGIRPYLRGTYENLRYYPGLDTTGFNTQKEIDDQIAASEPSATVKPKKSHTDLNDAITSEFGDIKNNRDMKRLIADTTGVKPADVTLEQMKNAQEFYESIVSTKAREIVKNNGDSRETYDKLVTLYKSMPNLNVRSGDSMARQAYSTPPPFAYITSLIGGLTKKGTTWDNSSGHGMLLLRTDADNAIANELDYSRYQALKDQGFAALNRNALEVESQPSYKHVIGNPPFGKMDGDYVVHDTKMTTIDHALVAQSLESMADNGTGSFIIGANRVVGGETAADRRFFKWLYSNYRVVDHVELDGKLYTKQGASWPLRMISVRGREKSEKIGPKSSEITRLDSWDKLYEHYESVNDALADGGVKRSNSISQHRDNAAADRIRGLLDGDNAKASKSNQRDEPNGSGERSSVSGNQHVSALGDTSKQSGNVQADNRADGDFKNGASTATKDSDSGRSEDAKSRTADAVSDSGNNKLGDDLQTPYRSASGLSSLGALVPSNMRDPLEQFYKTLRSEVGDIDTYVKDKLGYAKQEDYKKAFMGLQADAVAAAIYNYDKNGQGIIIADQTGIGKGRQAAAMIRYARRISKTPIFISVKPNLFTDMYDDLHDIGETDVVPFIMNGSQGISKEDANGNKTTLHKSLSGAKQKAVFSEILKTGKLPEGTNVMFATYSQVTTDNIQRKVIDKLAGNSWIILDEAHNMAGNQFNVKKGGHKVMTGGGFINTMTEKAATTYLSATYAKRPDNMSAFTKTALSEAFASKGEPDKSGSRFGGSSDPFADAIAAGGAPLQTVIANELTKKGQLIRRERSFDGISIKAEFDNDNAAFHRKIADQLVLGLRAINAADSAFHELEVKNLKDAAKSSGDVDVVGAGNRAGSSVDHSAFSSVLHNYISQMLLGLKADYAANQAIELHRQGIKPVIALENTMGAFIDSNSEGLVDGDEFSMDYRDVLQKALDRTRRISVREKDDAKAVDVPLHELSASTQSLYADASALIDKLDLSGIPLSPIDYMKNKMQQAGINVGEITGRGRTLDYSSGSTPTLSRRSKKERDDRRSTVDDFNNGKLDAMVLNVAGSTGLSIHNSTKYPVEHQKKRHMIVVQMPLDINVMMQMLGRINRTGQRTETELLPSFTILGATIPAEKRPMATALNKLASLNANTSANTEGSTTFDAPNFFNMYGDEVVNQYLHDNRKLADQLDLSSDLLEPDKGGADGIAKKATGRLAAYATVDEQVAFYDSVEAEYKDLIEYKDSIGDNKLKSLNLDLKAKILESQIIHEGDKKSKNSAISGDAVAHRVVARQTRKPPDAKTVKAAIASSLGKKTTQQYLEDSLDVGMSDAQSKKQNEKIRAAFDALNELLSVNISQSEVKVHMEAIGDTADAKTKSAYAKYKKLKGSRDSRVAESRVVAKGMLFGYPVGKPVNLQMMDEGDAEVGVITGYQIKDNAKGNPLSNSQIRVEIMLASPTGKVKLPLSKLISTGSGNGSMMTGADTSLTVDDIFGKASKGETTENRVIITGNLLAAIGRLQKGQVTTFTDSKGESHTGLLLPRSYSGSFDRISSTAFAVTDGSAGVKMLDEGSVKELATDKQDVKITKGRRPGMYSLQIAKSGSSIATAIRTNRDFKQIGGDFYTIPSQNYYEMSVRGNILASRLVKLLNDRGVNLALPESMRGEYVNAGGQDKAKAGDFANTRKLPQKKAAKSGDDSFSRADGAASSARSKISKKRAESIVRKFSQRWKNGPKIKVVDSLSEVEGVGSNFAEDGQIQGVYRNEDKTVYIVAGAMESDLDVVRTLLHEVQHFAGREKYGKQAIEKMAALGKILKEMGGVKQYVEKNGVDYDYDWYDQQFKDAGHSESVRLAKHVDELLAVMASDKATGAGRLRMAARSALGAIRKWLRSLGLDLAASLPNDELVKMLNETQKVLNDGADSSVRPIKSRSTNAHKVWHGSPHKFEKFTTDAMGTGEGAQAYGWGLYFADRKGIAEAYKEELSNNQREHSIDGRNSREVIAEEAEKQGVFYDSAFHVQILMDGGYEPMEAIAKAIESREKSIKRAEKYVKRYPDEQIGIDQDTKLIDFFESLKGRNFGKDPEKDGALYEVDLAPSQDEYLSWDAELLDESDQVQDAIRDNGINKFVNHDAYDVTGEGIYKSLIHAINDGRADKLFSENGFDPTSTEFLNTRADQLASELLRKLGIRGIRYLNGMSRGGKKGKDGAFNYVIFDDADVVIEDSFHKPSKVVENASAESKRLISKSKDTLKRFGKRMFTKEGLLGDAGFKRKIESDAFKNVGEEHVANLVHDFTEAATKHFGKRSYNDIADTDLQMMNDYLGGQDVDVPEALIESLDTMRAYLDTLSGKMQESMVDIVNLRYEALSEDQKASYDMYLASEGEDGNIPASLQKPLGLIETIQGNLGTYLNRSYRAFDDPDWMDVAMANTELMGRAEEFIADNNPDLTPSQIRGAVQAVLQSAQDSGNFVSMISNGAKVGSKDVSFTKKRKAVPEVIRELLGEHKDPKLNFARSSENMVWYVANHTFLMKFRQDGLGVFMFESPEDGYAAQIAGKDSETMDPLNGLYTSTDIRQGMEDVTDDFNGSDFMRFLIRINSAIKYGKTILSPTTQMRNVMSAMFFYAANGHFNLNRLVDSFKIIKGKTIDRGDDQWREYIAELVGLGVLHDNPYASELKAAINDTVDMNVYEKSAGQGVKRILDFAQRMYGAGDDLYKLAGFEGEKLRQMEAGIPEDEAKQIAAERIRDGYPTYSMVPKGIRWVRRAPVIGTFVSFPWEVARTTINQVRFIKEEMQSGNKKAATQRAMGLAFVTGATYTASKLSMLMMGFDEEDDEAIRGLLPEWSENSQLLYLGYDSDGLPKYLDLTFLDAYDYIKRPITALLNGNYRDAEERAFKAVSEVVSPFIGADIGAEALGSLIYNKNSYGGQVYNPQDAAVDKARAISTHVRKAVQPGFASNIERIYMATTGEVSRSGREYNLGDESLALLGLRVSTLNIRQSMIYRSYDFTDKVRNSTAILSRRVGTQSRMSEEEVTGAFDSMVRSREKVYTDMSKLIGSAKKIGLTNADITRSLRAANVSKKNVAALIAGQVPNWEPSSRFNKSATERALASASNEERRRNIRLQMKERGLIINRLASSQVK